MVSFTKFLFAILPFAVLVATHNTITFNSDDYEYRTLSFTCNVGCKLMEDIPLPGKSSVTVQFPETWTGTIMAKMNGCNVPVHRILAEINFEPGMSFYDISAVDNTTDNSGIRFMHPVGLYDRYHRPGCDWFPCDNCYIDPPDKQTRTTTLTDFICEVGNKY
ncbi:hypothetical protein NHQ30_001832 [Ciborinia camelliae]|nr:hypothetical protein NHQ30_001832 [Ciborinia camelliae]